MNDIQKSAAAKAAKEAAERAAAEKVAAEQAAAEQAAIEAARLAAAAKQAAAEEAARQAAAQETARVAAAAKQAAEQAAAEEAARVAAEKAARQAAEKAARQAAEQAAAEEAARVAAEKAARQAAEQAAKIAAAEKAAAEKAARAEAARVAAEAKAQADRLAAEQAAEAEEAARQATEAEEAARKAEEAARQAAEAEEAARKAAEAKEAAERAAAEEAARIAAEEAARAAAEKAAAEAKEAAERAAAEEAARVAEAAAKEAARVAAEEAKRKADIQTSNESKAYNYDKIQEKYDLIDVHGDGWCFFHAVQGALGKNNNSPSGDDTIAIELIGKIIKSQQKAGVNPVYNSNQNTKQWATSNEIWHTASIINKCIVIFIKYNLNGEEKIYRNIIDRSIVTKNDPCNDTEKDFIYLLLDAGNLNNELSDLPDEPIGKHFQYYKLKSIASPPPPPKEESSEKIINTLKDNILTQLAKQKELTRDTKHYKWQMVTDETRLNDLREAFGKRTGGSIIQKGGANEKCSAEEFYELVNVADSSEILTTIVYQLCTDETKKYSKIVTVVNGKIDPANINGLTQETTPKEFVESLENLINILQLSDLDVLLLSKNIDSKKPDFYKNPLPDKFITELTNASINNKNFTLVPNSNDTWYYYPFKPVNNNYFKDSEFDIESPAPSPAEALITLSNIITQLINTLHFKQAPSKKSDISPILEQLNNLVNQLSSIKQNIIAAPGSVSAASNAIALANLINLITQLINVNKNTSINQGASMSKNELSVALDNLQKLTQNLVNAINSNNQKQVGKRFDKLKTGLDNLLQKYNPSTFFDKLKTEKLNNKLDEIERDITETLQVLGSPFRERAKNELEILKLTAKNADGELNVAYDPEVARKQYAIFENQLDEIREEMTRSKDDKKKFLAKFMEFITLLQDVRGGERQRIIQELNLKLQSDGTPIQFDLNTGANKFGREGRGVGGGLIDTGYNTLNQYNIQMDGGAENDTKKTETSSNDSNSPQKLMERIQELKIAFNKVNSFVENEVKAKYLNYKKQVFDKIFYNNDDNNSPAKYKKGDFKSDEYKITPAAGETPPQDEHNVLGLFKTIADDDNDKNKWLEEIKKKITENKNELIKIRDEFIKICDEPDVKNLNIFPSYKTLLKNTFDGDFSGSAKSTKDVKVTTTSNPAVQYGTQTGIIQRLDNISKALQARFDEARSALKPVASNFEKATKEFVEVHKRQGYFPGQPVPTQQGKGQGGGGDPVYTNDDVEWEINGFTTDNFNRANNEISKIEDVYRKRTNPAFAASIGPPGMFTNILNKFRLDNFDQGPIVAAQKMEESLKANKLLPSDVLKVSGNDRLIFAFVILFLRSITIQITEYFIGNGKIDSISSALIVFNVIYSAVFLLLIGYVNLDAYRLRIIFNYINLNGNSGVIMMHLGLLYLLTYGIFMIIWNLNFPVKKMKDVAVTDEDRAYLMYQLEIITMIVWVFLLILATFL